MTLAFNPSDPALFTSRGDPEDVRLGDLIQHIHQENWAAYAPSLPAIVMAGYPDDEGVRLNGGRVGAAGGPDDIRRFLFRMTPPVSKQDKTLTLCDAGNLAIAGSLAERHEAASQCAATFLAKGCRYLGLGGGHDYGFSDARAFIDYAHAQGAQPVVVNFDAHLDVRPTDKGLTSGTPFYRMLEAYGDAVDFIEVGIQDQCNARAHYNYASGKGAGIVMLNSLRSASDLQAFWHAKMDRAFSSLDAKRLAFLSVDIDCFAASVAPGCSQSWPTGLSVSEFFTLFDVCQSILDVRMLSIYEVAPALDVASVTSKLAAQIAYHWIVS